MTLSDDFQVTNGVPFSDNLLVGKGQLDNVPTLTASMTIDGAGRDDLRAAARRAPSASAMAPIWSKRTLGADLVEGDEGASPPRAARRSRSR